MPGEGALLKTRVWRRPKGGRRRVRIDEIPPEFGAEDQLTAPQRQAVPRGALGLRVQHQLQHLAQHFVAALHNAFAPRLGVVVLTGVRVHLQDVHTPLFVDGQVQAIEQPVAVLARQHVEKGGLENSQKKILQLLQKRHLHLHIAVPHVLHQVISKLLVAPDVLVQGKPVALLLHGVRVVVAHVRLLQRRADVVGDQTSPHVTKFEVHVIGLGVGDQEVRTKIKLAACVRM